MLACESSDELSAVGLAIRDDVGVLRMLVANLTPAELDVVIGPLHGEFALRRLNEATATVAASDPAAFRARSENVTVSTELELSLRRSRSPGWIASSTEPGFLLPSVCVAAII